jgi:ABC-2 type transport system permease protein
MSALVRSELLKLRTTRALVWLLLATVAMQLVAVIFTVPRPGVPSLTSLDDPALLARVVGVTVLMPQLTIALLGVLAYTQEVRYGTITSTSLSEPRRRRVLWAKAIALTLASAAIAAATVVVSTIVGAVLIRIRDGNATAGAEFWQVVAAAFVVLALSALIGLAVGALVGNQIVAVAATLIWLTVGEHLLIQALPQVAKWTPVGAISGMLQLGAEATTAVTLLSPPVGLAFLVLYTAVGFAIALIVVPRRDVL